MNKFYVFFVITLICTLPVHHAHALSVKVSGNQGNAGVDGYLNGNGDVWELTTTLTNLEVTPTPEQVKLEIGSSSTPFTSCSGDGANAECKFISDLSDGISPGTYPFKVAVYDVQTVNNETIILDDVLGSDTENVYVDAKAPIINFLSAEQIAQDVHLDFVAYDPDTCSGLRLIEVYDNSDGTVLDSITFDDTGVCEYSYDVGNRAGVLPSDLGDQGATELRIRATDWMGIQGVSNVVYFTRDFVDPVADSIAFPGTLSIGTKELIVNTQVNITECSGLTEVLLVSEQINYKSIPGDVSYKGDCHYEVTWDGVSNSISFTPLGETVTLKVVMQDQYENIGEDVLTYTFDRDTTAPEVTFFGTQYVYNDVSYMADDMSTNVVATIQEDGSGLAHTHVIASFTSLGSDDYRSADYCTNKSSVYTCVWEDVNAGGEGTRTEDIRLIQVMDKAGNDFGTYTQALVIDDTGPSVLDMEIVSVSEYGEFESFKSGDDVLIKMKISETSGVVAKIDVRDLVMDAETKYNYGTDPEDDSRDHEDNGFAIFNQDSCQRDDDGHWDCEFTIEKIRTGYVSGADMNILLYDTAMNIAQEWDYTIENGYVQCSEGSCEITILAADYDTVPDLWEQGAVDSGTYILLDISDATYPRQDFRVSLHSDGARLENHILQGCTAPDNAPLVNRPILLGGIAEETPRMTFVMELQPFDSSLVVPADSVEFTQVEIEYNCTVLLFSSRDKVTYTTPEEQTLVIPVTFGFSDIGALEEQVPAMIDEIKESGSFKFLKTMNDIAEGLKIAQRILDIGTTVQNILEIIGFFKSTVTVANCAADKVRGDPSCLSGTNVCAAIDAGTVPVSKFLHGINSFSGILFCDAQPITVPFSQLGDVIKKGKERELNRLTADPTSTPPAAPAATTTELTAAGEAQAPNKDTKHEKSEKGGAGYYDFVAAVRQYQTSVVTIWSILRGQFLVTSLTGLFTKKSNTALDKLVQNTDINKAQQEILDIEAQIRAMPAKDRELYYENYMAWADMTPATRTDASKKGGNYFDFEKAKAGYYATESNGKWTPNRGENSYYEQLKEKDSLAYTMVDGTPSGVKGVTSITAISQQIGGHLIKAEAVNSWNQILTRGVSATLYDNIWVSMIGVCLPGIAYNLQKLYLIQCSYVHCLQNDVPMGLATIDTCTNTKNYLECRFWRGDVIGQIVGMIGNFAEGITDLLISFISDPISIFMAAATLVCGQTGCRNAAIDNGAMITACTVYQVVGMGSQVGNYVKGWIDTAENNQGAFKSCIQVEESLTQTVEGETSETETTETGTTGTTTVSEQ